MKSYDPYLENIKMEKDILSLETRQLYVLTGVFRAY